MPRDLGDGRVEVIIVAIDGVPEVLLGRIGRDGGVFHIEIAKELADGGVVGDPFGDDVARARKRILERIDALLGIDVLFGLFEGKGAIRRLFEENLRERLEALLLGDRRPRSALLLEGTVQVFDFGERRGFLYLRLELGGELTAAVDGLDDFRLPRLEVAKVFETVRKGTDGLIVHFPVHLLAIAGDEGDGVALVEKGNDVLDVLLFEVEFCCNCQCDIFHKVSCIALL